MAGVRVSFRDTESTTTMASSSPKALKRVEDLIEQCLEQSGPKEPGAHPKILFLGNTGSGKSSLASTIRSACGGTLRVSTIQIEQEVRQSLLAHDRIPESPDYIVYVKDINSVAGEDGAVKKTLKTFMQHAKKKSGIPGCVILTHIDELKPDNWYEFAINKGSHAQFFINKAADDAGVCPSRVFLVKNYTEKEPNDPRQGYLIVNALQEIWKDIDCPHTLQWKSHRLQSTQQTPSPAKEGKMLGKKQPMPLNSTDIELGSSPRVPWTLTGLRPHNSWTSKDSGLDINCSPYSSWSSLSEASTDTVKDRHVGLVHSGTEATGRKKPSTTTCRTSKRPNDPAKSSDVEQSNRKQSTKKTVRKMSGEITSLLGPSSSTDRIENLQSTIQKLSDLDRPFDYVDIQRAKTNCQSPPVFPGSEACLQLVKHMFLEDVFYKNVAETILSWSAAASSCSIWMSDTLPVDLSLPLEYPESASVDVQAFILATDKPPVLLTICDPTRSGNCQSGINKNAKRKIAKETELVRTQTVAAGRLLSSALLNYCCCNFVILPCVIVQKELSVAKIQEAIVKQAEECRKYYDQPIDLDRQTYDLLKTAATFVARVTAVPLYMGLPTTAAPLIEANRNTPDRQAGSRGPATASRLASTIVFNDPTGG